MYYKIAENGYILMFGEGEGGAEISKAEYAVLKKAMQSRPKPPVGFDYRLKEDLTWELYELPAVSEEDEELTAEEAMEELREVLE